MCSIIVTLRASKALSVMSTTQYIIVCFIVHRCSSCVVASGVCGWCQLDFECTGDNTTCIGGPSNWLTVSVVFNNTIH